MADDDKTGTRLAYTDRNGKRWALYAPKGGSDSLWHAELLESAYGLVAGSRPVAATTQAELEPDINAFLDDAAKGAPPVARGTLDVKPDAEPASGSSWLFLALLAGFYYATKKGR